MRIKQDRFHKRWFKRYSYISQNKIFVNKEFTFFQKNLIPCFIKKISKFCSV